MEEMEELTKEQHLEKAREIIEDLAYHITSDLTADPTKYEYIGCEKVYDKLNDARFHLRMADVKGEPLNMWVLKASPKGISVV